MQPLQGFSAAKVANFKNWLSCHGCEILPSTNEYEVVRFRHAAGVGVIYTNANKTHFKSNNVHADEAWECFKFARQWTNRVDGTRRSMSKAHKALMLRDGDRCFYCGKHLFPEAMTEEHLLSLIHGGSNRVENKVLSCQPCNQEAGNLPLVDKIRLWDSKKSLRDSNKEQYS